MIHKPPNTQRPSRKRIAAYVLFALALLAVVLGFGLTQDSNVPPSSPLSPCDPHGLYLTWCTR